MSTGVIAITGATGFLGRRLVEQSEEAGWRARVLIRSTPAGDVWENGKPEIVSGSLGDPGSLRELVSNADVVVHLAGLIKARSRRDFFEVNAAGARRLAQASGGRRLIHVSSLAARNPELSDYAASKRAGEDAVREVGGNAVTIVRPPVIYGPGDRETFTLFKNARGPVAFAPANSIARMAIAEVDDVASVIIDLAGAAQNPPMVTIGGARPAGYSWIEIVAAAARAVGARPMIVPIPAWVLMMTGATLEEFGKWRPEPPIFTRGKAREALHPDWSVSKLEEGVTAGRAYKPLDEGFAGAVAWYRSSGWLL